MEVDAWVADRLGQAGNVTIALPTVGGPNRPDNGRPQLGRVVAPTLVRRHRRWPLYRYQRIGVRRLLTSRRCLLADDMGLGKTLQVVVAVTALLQRGECRRVLIVVPTSVLYVWRREFLRWSPSICVRTADGGDARSIFRESWNVAHVVLTNYEQMRTPPTEVTTSPPDVLVLDEAHRIKNWNSQVATGMRSLAFKRAWALTGTPLEKGKVDLVGLMSFLDPGRFGQQDRKLPSWLLRAKTRPYALRREKNEVLNDLPTISFRRERVRLYGTQRLSYRRAQHAMGSASNVLAAFTTLRTLCDFEPETGVSAKIDRTVELVTEICLQRDEKAVVFSYLLRPLALLADRLDVTDVPYVGVYRGKLTASERNEMLEQYRDLNKGVLLASMRTAGEGLTLTDANNVVLINRWWNPSANAQAVDRVHRIGQMKAVTVYVLEAVNTIDERLSEILRGKEDLFDDVVARLARSGDIDAL